MTSCMRSKRAFDNPDAHMDLFLPAVLFRLPDGAAIAAGEATRQTPSHFSGTCGDRVPTCHLRSRESRLPHDARTAANLRGSPQDAVGAEIQIRIELHKIPSTENWKSGGTVPPAKYRVRAKKTSRTFARSVRNHGSWFSSASGTRVMLHHQSRIGAQCARRSRALQAFNINFVHL